MPHQSVSPDDVLYGMPAIAQAFGWRTRQPEHLKDAHGLPTFKVGKTVFARRSAAADWLRAREAAGKTGRTDV